MDQSRQGDTQQQLNHQFIIKSKKNWWREIMIGLFTLFVWFYCLSVVYFFIDALFSSNHEYPQLIRIVFNMTTLDVISFINFVGLLFALLYTTLYAWSYYNRKKYGSLNRRKYPGPTTQEDLMNLNIIDEINYEILQNEKTIVFNKNPIQNGGKQNECLKKSN